MILLLLIGIGIIGSAAGQIKSSNDPMLMFGPQNEHRQKLLRQQAEFGDTNQTMLVLSVESPEDLPMLLAAERALTLELQSPDGTIPLDGLSSFASISSMLPMMGYPLDFTPIEDVAVLLDERAGLRAFFLNDARNAVVFSLKQNLPDMSDDILAQAYQHEQALKAHMQALFPDVQISVAGNVAIAEALRGALAFDQTYLLPLTLVLNFFIMLIAFGSLRLTLCALGMAVATMVLTLGMAGWSGVTFGTGSQTSFAIVTTLTVATLIHIVHSLGQRQRALPFQSTPVAVRATFRKLVVPIILAHTTTAIGFLSLNFADAPAFQLMGTLVAGGLAFSMVIVLFAAPLVFARLCNGCKVQDAPVRAASRVLTKLWSRHPLRMGYSVALMTFIAVGGLVFTRFDDQFLKFFGNDHPLRQNVEQIEDAMGWSQAFDLVLRYAPDTLVTPAQFEQLDGLVAELEALPGVVAIASPIAIVRSCLRNRTPPYTGSFADVPEKMLTYCVRSNFLVTETQGNGTFAANFAALRISVLSERQSSSFVRNLSRQVEDTARTAGFAPLDAEVSGVNVMSSFLSKVNTESMLVGSAVAMAIVSVILGLFLRSFALALLSILPNFLPAMAALGIWVWLNTEVGMAASIIAALTFGIVVDDTIHILYALTRGRKKQTNRGVQRVLQKVFPGVLTTTAALGFGFALLMASGFEVNRQLGFLTSTTIWIAFFFDLFVLPGAYIWLIGRKRLRGPKPDEKAQGD
ncbi:MAG: MMPL family transporter [Paracoccaceae bacterium]